MPDGLEYKALNKREPDLKQAALPAGKVTCLSNRGTDLKKAALPAGKDPCCSAFLGSVPLLRYLLVSLLTVGAAVSAASDTASPAPGASFTVMTFNTGTGKSTPSEGHDNLGYGREQAALSDEYYGNSLAWKPAIEAVREFVQGVSPDIIAFQELFYCEDCADIPEAARAGFVCEDWTPGSPTVAQTILGADYQIATHANQHDKCLAVHKRFGRIRGCDSDFCPGGLEGFPVEGCGSGARVGRAVIERVSGETLTVLSFHGTSGFLGHDRECRARQVDRIFVDFGDGAPGVNGSAHVILGDFNTDPRRMRCIDRSAQRWNRFVGADKPFHFVTDTEQGGPGAYLGCFHIDHIVSDVFRGEVLNLGESGEIFPFRMFDHTPILARMEPVGK